MAVSFTPLPWCWWGGTEKEPANNGSSVNSSFECGFGGMRDPGAVQFPSVKGTKMASSPRKVKRKWLSREERRVDREYDIVIVPSDGGEILSGSESDDSDWSIGWLEPHGPGFQSDDDKSDNSYAVLVPCYSPGCKEVVEDSNNELLSAIKNLSDEFSSDCKNYMKQWLSSLQNFDA
ncbi:hypothetical protein D8674_013418 [Pyrus ussuriensis x Pyrus communis]|uniref:Uncharacterized protein n=1 Tax=Pyrus ussuriensis x Pyrus communis TaxID=2448454 RepID=A0A5N5GPS8_9ROSA|nr:uncharacterized protein LOC103954718 [Pyrus x bretschneideri]XP_018504798.2 uncharacterized protein LOC103954718 [Pyrus x bretschneideri]XP_018504799.2 uncharacterized protein LOC103954718 [Pyrus x bretschneideri]KAB2617549.1 hypothetical protein D8674_013418 [Pyrus ussuriensis x Pyrus communis]